MLSATGVQETPECAGAVGGGGSLLKWRQALASEGGSGRVGGRKLAGCHGGGTVGEGGAEGRVGPVVVGAGAGAAAGPVAEESRRESPGCGGSGAVRGPGGLERAPWRGRAGPGLSSDPPLVAFRRLFAAGASPWLLPREDAGRRGRW